MFKEIEEKAKDILNKGIKPDKKNFRREIQIIFNPSFSNPISWEFYRMTNGDNKDLLVRQTWFRENDYNLI